jgi:two-component system sensor histidine kinase DesK
MSKLHLISEFCFYFLFCVVLMTLNGFQAQDLFYMLTTIILSGLCLLFQKGAWIALASCVLLSFFWPAYSLFLPFVFRSALISKTQEIILLICLCSLLLFSSHSLPIRLLLILLMLSVSYLRNYSNQFLKLREQLTQTKDATWEKENSLRDQNEQLKKTQETEIALQISEERNRIARDIHDNVGHLLSSAILQLGAIEVINDNQKLMLPLDQLNQTIHAGMDRIRESVHDLHDHSIPFPQALHFLLTDFLFCPVEVLGMPPENLSQEQQTIFITVIKEALTNVTKHSQATKVTLFFKELPAFYRLQIKNDGVFNSSQNTRGIGLQTMTQRIDQGKGQLHVVQKETVFQLTIILPKEDNQ